MYARWFVAVPLICTIAHVSPAWAGAVDHRTNSSADWARNPVRNALSRSVDAVAYNPAGVTDMPEGAHVGLSGQGLISNLSHNLTNDALNMNETYKSDNFIAIPTLYGLYRFGDWAVMGGFNIPAGGGKLDYPDGSATTRAFELQAAQLGQALGRAVALDLSTNVSMVYYGGILGGAYAINDMFSVSVAARYIYGTRGIIMDDANATFGVERLADHQESASGFGGIVGFDAKPIQGLVLSLRYETPVSLEWEVDESSLPTALTAIPGAEPAVRRQLPAVGSTYQRDLPQALALGAAYDIMPELVVSWLLNYYFQRSADWDGAEKDHKDGWETGLGAEYTINELVMASAGAIYTRTGASKRALVPENPGLDAVTVGAGAQLSVIEDLRVNVGVSSTFYTPDEYNNPALGKIEHEKKRIIVIAVGVDWKFL